MMDSKSLRKKFVEFFTKNSHKHLPASSLIPEDPSVLFTSAGMQQFKFWFSGEQKPKEKNVVTVQPCFRTSDIDLVGDANHLTFLEMLGNFSFGGYLKRRAIELAWDFIVKELKIPPSRITISVFAGDQTVPEDKESVEIWKSLGVPAAKIKKCSRVDNFWGPTGDQGPCGPTTELYVDKTEVWNIVFNQYYQDKNGKLKPLKTMGVDTGMGLERLAMVMQKKDNVYQTDLYSPLVSQIEKQSKKTKEKVESVRIIADHIRAIVFLISENILPSNKEQGYVLRRILRRAIVHGKLLDLKEKFLTNLADLTIEQLSSEYKQLSQNKEKIKQVISSEEEKFGKTLFRGLNLLGKKIETCGKELSGADCFMLYDTFGFPLELTKEICFEKGIKIDKESFQKEMEKQKQRARKSQVKLQGKSNPKLHSACHLLHQVLREILGKSVEQRGQDITGDTLRFDFSYPQKLTDQQIKKIEQIVNEKIKQNLKVGATLTTVKEAKEKGAIALFTQKYGEKVTMYSIEDPKTGKVYSRELCAGPHVKETGEIGSFQIVSEKAAGSGIRRIKAKIG